MNPKNEQPSTVFISVNPRYSADAVQILHKTYCEEDFRAFIHKSFPIPEKNHKTLSDNWMFAYEFQDGGKLPPLAPGANHSNFFRCIHDIASRENIKPVSIIPLRDACYCHNYGIDMFSDEGQHRNVIQQPGYKSISTHFAIFGQRGDIFPTCRAVDIGSGVLLYDRKSVSGEDAYKSFMQFCADHYFDPSLNIDRMKIYELHTFLDKKLLEEHCATLNFNFNYHGRDFTFRDLMQLPLIDSDILREGLPAKEYDMHPTSENYSLFLSGENVNLQPHTHTFDIAILDQIHQNGFPRERLSSEWHFVCHYLGNFKDLADEIVICDDPKKMDSLQQEAKHLAQALLDRDFPERRQITQNPEQSLMIEIPSENFHQGPKL